MKLKDYIEQGYTVLTTGRTARGIKSKYPNAQVVDVKHPVDGISFTKLLVDWYIKEESYVKNLELGAKLVTTVIFNKSFCGDLGDCKSQEVDCHKDKCKTDDTNLLEIKLKNLDSDPEVYYKGVRVFDETLIEVTYRWATEDDKLDGKQYICIEGLDETQAGVANRHLSKNVITHRREATDPKGRSTDDIMKQPGIQWGRFLGR